MYRSAPEITSSNSETPRQQAVSHLFADNEPSAAEKTYAHKIARRHLWGQRAMVSCALATALVSPVELYATDVQENQAKAALSTPEIDPITSIDSNIQTESAIFSLAGFDTLDGSVYGKQVGITLHNITDGEILSVNYGNAPLDPREIGEKIIQYAREHSLGRITLSGNSQGGIVTVDVAEYIISHSYLEIDMVHLNSTPDGLEGLLPQTRENLEAMLYFLQLPHSKYSSFARYAATMAQESGRFTNGSFFDNVGSFLKVSNETIQVVNEDRRPGMWLIVDQANAIITADLEGSFATIGSYRDTKRMPSVVVTRPTNASDDTTVNVERSSENICRYAEEASLTCHIVLVDDAPHTSWNFNTKAFDAAFSDAAESIRAGIERERTAFALSRQALYSLDTILPQR